MYRKKIGKRQEKLDYSDLNEFRSSLYIFNAWSLRVSNSSIISTFFILLCWPRRTDSKLSSARVLYVSIRYFEVWTKFLAFCLFERSSCIFDERGIFAFNILLKCIYKKWIRLTPRTKGSGIDCMGFTLEIHLDLSTSFLDLL